MQVVGHLVGVGADQRGLDLVDGPVKGVERHAAQLPGKGLLQAGVEKGPEAAAAPDEVLPQARLALVHAGGGAAAQGRALQIQAHPLLVHSVARLVHGGKEGVAEEILLDAGGDAHVVDGKAGGEGVGRLVLAAALEIVAKAPDHVQAELPLQRLGEGLVQAGVVGRRLGGDGRHQRHELLAQVGEQGAHGRGLHAIVGPVDERVGHVLVAGKVARVLAAQFDGPLQVGARGGKIVGRPRPGPDLVGFGGVAVEFGHKVGRHLDRLFILAAGDAQQAGLVGVVGQALLVGAQVFQQLAQGRVGEFLVGQPLQGGGLAGAGRGAAGRHVGRLVPAQQRRGGVEVMDLGQAGL